jgi:hypothetical protein
LIAPVVLPISPFAYREHADGKIAVLTTARWAAAPIGLGRPTIPSCTRCLRRVTRSFPLSVKPPKEISDLDYIMGRWRHAVHRAAEGEAADALRGVAWRHRLRHHPAACTAAAFRCSGPARPFKGCRFEATHGVLTAVNLDRVIGWSVPHRRP